MRRIIRSGALAVGAACMTAAGAVSGAVPASAAGTYSGAVKMQGAWFTADICWVSSAGGAGSVACTGTIGDGAFKRLSVAHNPGDTVWMDVNVVWGDDRRGINLRGNRYCEVSGNVITVRVTCWPNAQKIGPGTVVHG